MYYYIPHFSLQRYQPINYFFEFLKKKFEKFSNLRRLVEHGIYENVLFGYLEHCVTNISVTRELLHGDIYGFILFTPCKSFDTIILRFNLVKRPRESLELMFDTSIERSEQGSLCDLRPKFYPQIFNRKYPV